MEANLLLVEDDPDSWRLLMLRLGDEGCDVTLAKTGEEAVEAATSEQFDLILMDLKLPQMSGYEAIAQIKKNLPEEEVPPIIAVTAHAMLEDREEALCHGCDDYHAKPIDFSKLLRQIKSFL